MSADRRLKIMDCDRLTVGQKHVLQLLGILTFEDADNVGFPALANWLETTEERALPQAEREHVLNVLYDE